LRDLDQDEKGMCVDGGLTRREIALAMAPTSAQLPLRIANGFGDAKEEKERQRNMGEIEEYRGN
jgi:hypothetical protein